MRKALIIGIDHYDLLDPLSGCVNDANSLRTMLATHDDKTQNFLAPNLLTSAPSSPVRRSDIKDAARELFSDPVEVALFYFAGHGHLEDTGGYICSTESDSGDDGLPLADIVGMAAKSPALNKVIILDSCHGGVAGDRNDTDQSAELREGMTILTASSKNQLAFEVEGGGAGVFTSLLLDALGGAAANLVGDVTPGSVYAHIDQSLGTWGQRPMFKTNVRRFVSLRRAKAPIELGELKALSKHFPTSGFQLQLDPSFEPERSPEQLADANLPLPDPRNTAVFKVLQNYVRVNLVRPVGAEHMWHSAMGYKSCELTVLGRHYRNLVVQDLI